MFIKHKLYKVYWYLEVDDKMMDKVSIIIPVYNSEKYFEECIKSVINQTYNNIEIILINDGSEDNSLSICEKYSKLDNRIKLINNKKLGVSSARNSGLSISTGKYVMFLDSDDYFSDDYVERMYKTIEKTKSDIVISGFRCFENNKEEIIQYSNEDKYLELDSIINDMVNTYYFNSISKTITKLDIIKNNNIEFDISLTYFEDYKFSFMVMKKCKKIFYISNCFYNYRINEDSSTRKLSFEKVFKWFNDNNSVIDYIYSNDNSLKNIEPNRIKRNQK